MATTPDFKFPEVYNQLIEEGGKSRVIFINGGPLGSLSGIQEAWTALDNSLKLNDSSWKPDAQNNQGSVWFDPVINPNLTHFGIDFYWEVSKVIFQKAVSAVKPGGVTSPLEARQGKALTHLW